MENHNIPSEAKIEAITQNVDVVHKRIAFTNANMRNLTMMAVSEFYDTDLNTTEKVSAMANKIINEYYKKYIAQLANASSGE